MSLTLHFERYEVSLKLTSSVSFHFNHGGVINGLLCNALGEHPLPPGVIPSTSESGRVQFEAGESYRFGVTCVGSPMSDDPGIAERLTNGLDEVGQMDGYDAGSGTPPTLGGNFTAVHVDRLPFPDLKGQQEILESSSVISLHFISPLRMQRPKDLEARGARYLNDGCFPVDHFLDRLWGRFFRFVQERPPTPSERERLKPPRAAGVRVLQNRLLWLDVPIRGKIGKSGQRQKGHTIGGVLGIVKLEGVPSEWYEILVLGQYLHAGQFGRYGFGRYRIVECAHLEKEPFRPARTLLDRLQDRCLLRRGFDHVVDNSVAAGVDGISPRDARADADRMVETLFDELCQERHAPMPLLGIIDSKPGGKVRPLTIPTVRDRTVQRAACELLGPSIEMLLEDCSYAYRKGFSRANAAQAIRRDYGRGYRYVLDADIESFFDAVDWERLFGKLKALFGNDPLLDIIEHWIRAPVVFEGRELERSRGLPQGAVISPMLANLYLDEFDEELLDQNYRLVRYADDFVVLCKSLEEARQAKEHARASLDDLGLELHPEKTDIRAFEAGFTYLGYLFCRSVVLDKKKEKVDDAAFAKALSKDAVPEASWLAQVPFEQVRAVVARRVGGRKVPKPTIELVPLAAPAPMPAVGVPVTDDTPTGRPLYVFGSQASLFLREGMLCVEEEDGDRREVALRQLSHLILVGQVRATVPLLLSLSREGVPTFFCRRTGELYAEFAPRSPDWRVWQAQAERAADEDLCFQTARSIVQAKLNNYAVLTRRFELDDAGNIADELRRLEKSCLDQKDLDQLRGLEGRGAAVYFGAMRETLPARWGFEGRRKNPPPDPVNAMLSFGYTLLYNHIATSIVAAGLNPCIGLFHRDKGAYFTLACDLQEELRYIADAHVWAMINRNEVNVEDFAPSKTGRYPCLMTRDVRRSFILGFERRLAGAFTPSGFDEPLSYRTFMSQQATSIKNVILGRAPAYVPLRIRA